MSDYFERVERQIVRQVETGLARTRRGRLRLGNLAMVAAVLVVIVVAGVFLAARGNEGAAPPPASHPAFSLSFTASPADPRAINQSVTLLRERLHAVLPGAQVAATGDGVTVTLSRATPGARSRILALSAPGRLAFYDWEASVITPDGKSVASQLKVQDPTALTISQGSGSAAPGDSGAGCLSLSEALNLAAKQPPSDRAIVVQAIGQGAGIQGSADGYFVLRDDQALSGSAIVDARASTDPNTKIPDVIFDLTQAGRHAFQALTAKVAQRGDSVSGLGETLNQHFAIAIDNRLITVPYVDYKVYPDGVDAAGVDLSGNFTVQSARATAALLRYGPLPVNLTAAG
ncbi:MAG: hypothetical protein JO130_06840 [Solirubrobacterales bacterium]|nr:hypothetical protein [Solirubrobacterales bacterium]